MDEQDKEFETYLRQFHLRQHAAFPEIAGEAASRQHAPRWILAAVAALVVAAISLPVVRHFMTPVLPGAIVELPGDSRYATGETIVAGNAIHSGGFETLRMRLEDETEVEMRAQTEIVLEPAEDGARIRLNNGSIVVWAAKQRDGHLYVQTKDTVVSVVGTVFLVESLPEGSRVAVLEGEVEVRLGTEVQKLLRGQQVSSNSEIRFKSIEELIAWSVEAELKPLFVGERDANSESERTAVTQGVAPAPLPATRGGTLPPGKASQQQNPQDPPPPPPPPPPPAEGQQPSDAGANDRGKEMFYRACVSCHSDEIVKNRRWPSREAIANRVPTDVAYGARLSPSEVQAVIDFIWSTWGNRQ